MTTMKQLAQLAGVSSTTVFRALRNTGRVSADTRRRILELASLYQCDLPPYAQRSAPADFNAVACILPGLLADSDSSLVAAVSERALSHGYTLAILQTHNQLVHVQRALLAACDLKVRGVLVHSGFYEPITREAIWDLWSRGITLVAADVTPTEIPVDRVSVDYDALALMSLEYLTRIGHRKIAFIGCLSHGIVAGHPLAMQKAFRHYGLHEALFLDREQPTYIETLTAMLKSVNPPTAIIAMSDTDAYKVVKAASDLQLRIPRDLSVLGCDNTDLCELCTPPLTSIDTGISSWSADAAEVFFQRLKEATNPAEREPRTVLYQPKLIIRQSCAPPKR
jgi:DNA-binding LacI/PurR family transcriptional regulator